MLAKTSPNSLRRAAAFMGMAEHDYCAMFLLQYWACEAARLASAGTGSKNIKMRSAGCDLCLGALSFIRDQRRLLMKSKSYHFQDDGQ